MTDANLSGALRSMNGLIVDMRRALAPPDHPEMLRAAQEFVDATDAAIRHVSENEAQVGVLDGVYVQETCNSFDEFTREFIMEAGRNMLGVSYGEISIERYTAWKATSDVLWGANVTLDNLADLVPGASRP